MAKSLKQYLREYHLSRLVKFAWLSIIFLFITGFVHTGYSVAGQTDDDDLTEKIAALFKDYNTETQPGCAVSVYRNGQTVFRGNYGMANLDYDIPIGDNSVFYMASISKQVTAATAALFILREEISLNDPVSVYIDNWPYWAGDVQISHLFNHTSGLPDIYDLMNIGGISLSNVMTISDYVEIIRNGEALKHQPGTRYSYTNSGYTILAAIVESVTEMPFSEAVKKKILDPLGMENTHFHDSRHRVIPNRVISYAPGENGFRQTYLSNFQGVGPGGLYSTLEDWQKWDAFWHGNTEVPDEFKDVKDLMITREIVDNKPLDYGWGLQITEWKGQQVTGHSGSFMGFKNDYRQFPEHSISFLTLCNRADADAGKKNKEMARLFLTETFEEFLEPYSGTYHNSELETDYELTIEDGRLILNRRLSPNGPLSEYAFDHWKAGSWDFHFQRNENDEITGFLLSTGRALDVEFVKK